MKLSPLSLGGAVLALLLGSASPARADLIPWLYSWSSSPDTLQADAPGTSTITLSSEPLKEAIGDSEYRRDQSAHLQHRLACQSRYVHACELHPEPLSLRSHQSSERHPHVHRLPRWHPVFPKLELHEHLYRSKQWDTSSRGPPVHGKLVELFASGHPWIAERWQHQRPRHDYCPDSDRVTGTQHVCPLWARGAPLGRHPLAFSPQAGGSRTGTDIAARADEDKTKLPG